MRWTVVGNRYRVLRLLGSGGMGEVYLAQDEILGREVALKVLNEQHAKSAEFVKRFRREAKSAASLSHPNVVQVYDAGEEEDGTPYMAMEWVAGGTLAERIAERTLGAIEAVDVALQVARALSEAHAHGIIHRDIKPQNVLVTASGEAKVADFGIARAAEATVMTQTSLVLGTVRYLSPEQAMGEAVGPASDLYSLGVVLYEMLTGEVPFEAGSPIATAIKHITATPPCPRAANPAVPEGLNAITMRLLAKDPAERYEDAEKLADDLERVSRGLPPTGASFSGSSSEEATVKIPSMEGMAANRRTRRRTPLLMAAVAGALFLALLGTVGYALLGDLWPRDSAPPRSEALARAARAAVLDVRGTEREEAERVLRSAGFRVAAEYKESAEEDEGEVIAQRPRGGEEALRGSTVTITVGEGPDTTAEPHLKAPRVPEAAPHQK